MRVCVICKKSFEPIARRQIVCCEECKRIRKKEKERELYLNKKLNPYETAEKKRIKERNKWVGIMRKTEMLECSYGTLQVIEGW